MTKRGIKLDKEIWWWNDEVQRALKGKKKANKNLRASMEEGAVMKYKKSKKESQRAVAKAKEAAWRELYKNLETKEGAENIYKIARA